MNPDPNPNPTLQEDESAKALIDDLHSLESEESLGQPFDSNRQEAVAARRDPSQPDHLVLETFQRGYRRGNEVFRPAKAVVNDLSHADSTPNGG